MTVSSPSGAASSSISAGKSRQATTTTGTTSTSSSSSNQQQASCPSTFNPSATFQQIKQTQASLARLSRVHQLNNQQSWNATSNSSNNNNHHSAHHYNNQSSQQPQQQQAKSVELSNQQQQQQQQKQTTFVDCLIRRFKDCFSEDFCTVPMFVVGNLSPGSDGTHLILPPCVSLGSQNINRFSCPKNLRLMNSIRESCRSIEELDLSGNKLTDLIEVYKILQCTQNLKFLNLSENDLSRSSPVAMAASFPASMSGSLATSPPGAPVALQQWPSANSRTCLAPLSQNQHQPLGPRRHHSTLGQSTSLSAGHQTTGRSPMVGSTSAAGQPRPRQVSRVAEARRLAAANALAQSKKTSSMVATKLANSAGGHQLRGQANRSARTRDGQQTAGGAGGVGVGVDTPTGVKQASGGRLSSGHRAGGPASTMYLARSLSSLSAKDVRGSSTSLGRLTSVGHHRRSSVRKSSEPSEAAAEATKTSPQVAGLLQTTCKESAPAGGPKQQQQTATTTCVKPASKLTTSSSHQKLLFEVEPPIVETDGDVDMGADQQQASPNSDRLVSSTAATPASSGGPNQTQVHTGSQTPARPYTGNSSVISKSSTLSSTAAAAATTTNHRRTFGSIKALALNNTGCPWRVVCSILSRMPNLEELHLSLNNYERIDLDVNEFKHRALKRLYLCNNPKLTNWEELDKLLIAFPSLEALSIADCNISQIPDNLDRAREWRKLCGLNINGWPIKEWPVVERLNQLPSLIDLKCRNLEVLASIDEPREHLIARLPKLQRLNGSEIEEREHAEKAFLRFFMANSHLERPSRFHELLQIHGEVVVSRVDVDVDLSPPSQASVRVIYLNRNYYTKENEDDILMSEDFLVKLMENIEQQQQQQQSVAASQQVGQQTDSSKAAMDEMDAMDQTGAQHNQQQAVRLFKDQGQEVVSIQVDLRQTVRKFKSTIGAIFGLKGQNLILYYIDHEMVGLMGPELIKHNQKKLWNYNVQDGDQFIVEEL